MSDLLSNINFKNDFRLKLKGSYSDLFLKSDILKNNDVIGQIAETCSKYGIQSSNIRNTGIDVSDGVGTVEQLSRNALGGNSGSIISIVINRIIPGLINKTENPCLRNLSDLQKNHIININTKDKSADVVTKVHSWSLRPFLRILLVSTTTRQQILELQFKIEFKVSIRTNVSAKSTLPTKSIIVMDIYAALEKTKTPLGTQPINLQFGSSRLEFALPE